MGHPLTPSLHSLGFLSTFQILDQIDPRFPRITLRVQTTTAAVACTECGTLSSRAHGAYWRRLGDVACFGRPTFLMVRVRRFRCLAPSCPRRTFAEPLLEVAPARARQTMRLRDVHRTIGLALGGNPGSRHAAAMGVPISTTTLLQRVREGDTAPTLPVTVLGVDDWAWRKGNRYGTILVDLERHAVIDLLPDRSAKTLAAWLKNHPSVAVVVRDRAGAYADGARQGAPDATQIADRWHLLRNSSDALRSIMTHHHRDLKEAARMAAPTPEPDEPAVTKVPEPEASPSPARPLGLTARRSQERRDVRYAEAARLRAEGASMRDIGRALGVERKDSPANK
jgi:transposase